MPLVSGGAAGVAPPVAITGTDPTTVPFSVVPAAGQINDIIDIGAAGDGILSMIPGVGVVLQGQAAWQAFGGPYFEITSLGTPPAGTGLLTVGGASSVDVRAPGFLVFNPHAAPADATLATGDCSLWFDQSAGAAKLMVKAKDSGGTVRTASIALA